MYLVDPTVLASHRTGVPSLSQQLRMQLRLVLVLRQLLIGRLPPAFAKTRGGRETAAVIATAVQH